MKIDKGIKIKENYKIIKASDFLLAKILCEAANLSVTKFQIFLDKEGKIDKPYHSTISNILRNYNGIYKDQLEINKVHNIVPLIFRNELALLLSGTTITPTLKCNYIALGSGTTSPANTDTSLETETIRGTWSNQYSVDNVAYFDKFFSSTEVGGNDYYEAGMFIDGTSGANTGYLLSHTAMSETLTSNQTLSISATITIS